MLMPAATDPNRAKEIERMKRDPDSFGTPLIQKYPTDWKEVGLSADRKEPTQSAQDDDSQEANAPKKRGRPAKPR